MRTNEKERALAAAKEYDETVEIVLCPVTDTELYFVSASTDRKFIFESFATCEECELQFHTSAMKMGDGMAPSSWSIHYLGSYCKTCYYKDEEPIEIIETVGTEEELNELDDLEQYLEEDEVEKE